MAAVPITFDVSEEPKRKVWTRQEVRSLEQMEFFAGQRYELIGGELIDKMGQNPPHASSVMLALRAFARVYGLDRVRAQLPIEVSQEDRRLNEPEPDIAVTGATAEEFESRHPLGTELILLVEISDSSLRMDRLTKASLYARAGVPEYWVLDLRRRTCAVHRDPVNGVYRDVREFSESDRVILQCGEIDVRELLPK